MYDEAKDLLYVGENAVNHNICLSSVKVKDRKYIVEQSIDLESYYAAHKIILVGDYLYFGQYQLDVSGPLKVVKEFDERIRNASKDFAVDYENEIYQLKEPYAKGLMKSILSLLEFLPNGKIIVYSPYIEKTIFLIDSASTLLDFNLDEYLNDFAIPEDLAKYTPPDIENHWAYDNLDDFVSADLLKGIKDDAGNVRAYPNKSITRAEFTTLLVRALDLKQPKGTPKSFKDVKPNDWFSEPVRIASSYGIVGGFEGGLFKPNEKVKRDQIASMIVRAFESKIKFGTGTPINFTEVPNYWAKKAITDASALGIVVGKTKTTFAPSQSATRAEAVVMLYRALHQETGQQPEQVEIEKIVLNYRKQIDLNTAAQDFQKVQQTIDQYTTGFFHATNELDLKLIHHLKSKGVNTSATLNGELRVVVIDIGPRFAVVEVTGGQYTYRFEKNGLSTSETVDSDGMLYLKKTTDGTWKIYNHFVNDPENVLM